MRFEKSYIVKHTRLVLDLSNWNKQIVQGPVSRMKEEGGKRKEERNPHAQARTDMCVCYSLNLGLVSGNRTEAEWVS